MAKFKCLEIDKNDHHWNDYEKHNKIKSYFESKVEISKYTKNT